MTVFTRNRLLLVAGAAAAAALTAGALIASTAYAATVGQPAPAFSEPDTAGKTRTLSEFAGKTVVLEWTNHGCPFVQKHYGSGNMQKLQSEITGQDVVWLSVVSSKPGAQGHVTPAEADELTRSRKASPTAVLLDPDGSMGRAFGARTTPHMYVIDPEGKIAYAGAIDSIASAKPADVAKADNYVVSAVAAVVAGRQPQPASTTPYGCGVKY